jgi:23S rRNA U2552 (ribose-2'-O)-methylase RlmE/FtsJ
MYQPFIFKLNSGKTDFLEKREKDSKDLILSATMNYPLFSLGFHPYISRTKDAMSITKNLDTKNEFYYVVNPFEDNISNYADSINSLTKHYLNIKTDNLDIQSRSFYKMWEMLFLFDLCNKKEMTIATISEGPGAFTQAVINFREKFHNGVGKDNIFNVMVNPEKGKVSETGKQFLGQYNMMYPELIDVKEYGAVNMVKTISAFKKDVEKSKTFAHLVLANGELNWEEENYMEQEAYQLILGEIVAALRVQEKDGNFVLKIFDTFTLTSIKMIYILSSFYETTYIYKPYFSRQINSEKYIVCKGFKYDQKKDSVVLNTKIKAMEMVLEKMTSNSFVFDIFPDFIVPREFVERFKFINIKVANAQQIMINDLILYIKENNYFGDKYHTYRDNQIAATKWWVGNFYPPTDNVYQKNKEELQKMLNTSIEKYNMEETKFLSVLVK